MLQPRSKVGSNPAQIMVYPQKTTMEIMSFILRCASPIHSYRSVRQGPKHIRVVSKEHYIEAVNSLERMSLGYKLLSPIGGVFFIKRRPAEICHILLEHKELGISVERYTERFNMDLPGSVQNISPLLRSKLDEVGYADLK